MFAPKRPAEPKEKTEELVNEAEEEPKPEPTPEPKREVRSQSQTISLSLQSERFSSQCLVFLTDCGNSACIADRPYHLFILADICLPAAVRFKAELRRRLFFLIRGQCLWVGLCP
jgi:hypothetical protein